MKTLILNIIILNIYDVNNNNSNSCNKDIKIICRCPRRADRHYHASNIFVAVTIFWQVGGCHMSNKIKEYKKFIKFKV